MENIDPTKQLEQLTNAHEKICRECPIYVSAPRWRIYLAGWKSLSP